MQFKRQEEIALVLILACLVGIFSFVSFGSGVVNLASTNEIGNSLEKINALKEELEEKQGILAQLYEEIERLKEKLARLEKQDFSKEKEMAAIKQEIKKYQAKIAKVNKEIAVLKAKIKEAEKGYIDVGRLGGSLQIENPLYIECVKEGLIIQPKGKTVSLAEIESLFKRIIEGEYCVVFLVRPSGFESFLKAREIAEKKEGLTIGYEPIDSSWKLKFPKGVRT